MSENALEARMVRDALGCALIVGGLLWLGLALGGVDPQAVEDRGYLGGVLSRSLESAFQGALLAALLAVPFHALWTALRYRGEAAGLAYDRFGAWAQAMFPAFGFIGTIIGVSLAVAGLEAAMTAEDPRALVDGLAVAFDTTFLGLCGAVLLMILRKGAQLWRAR